MPTEQKLMDHLFIKVDGSNVPTQAMDDLIEVTVDTSLHVPDMFTIHLHDERVKWVDEGPFGLGKEVEIAALSEEGNSSKTLFKGEITALEPDYGEGTQATLLVRGYDRSHRLHRGTHSKAYLQVTDSDLATRIAQEAGLRAQVDATTEVYDHVLQHNQTHMDFLTERAQRIGYEFFVEDKTLYFRKPSKSGSGGTLELEWGKQLKSFKPRLTLVEQVDEVIVKGWDPKNRQVIVGQASRGQAEPTTGRSQSGAQLASSAFKSARRVVVNRSVKSQTEADTMAQAVLDEISGAFVEAEGVCYGTPELRAGKFAKLSALGRQFNGTFFVTAATHIYRANAAYMTTFSIHGRRPETLHALVEQSAQPSEGRCGLGVAIALVTNNKDPEGRGRVKVKFPWLSDDVESDWARVVGLGAGADRGLYCLPEVNDEVLVAFENNDFARPYVIGGLWNGQDKPPLPIAKALENGKVSQRGFTTRAGHRLLFTDGTGKGIVLETAGGQRLTLNEEKKKVVLETASGQILTLDDSRKEISLESTATLTIKSGTNLNIEAAGRLSLKGANFSLQADAAGEVKASAALDIQGGIVKIN
jgi:phage protein D/phage baseplate assembly protein gpV